MLLERKGKIIPCRRAEGEKDAGIDSGKSAGIDSGKSGTGNLEAESFRSRVESTGGYVNLKIVIWQVPYCKL